MWKREVVTDCEGEEEKSGDGLCGGGKSGDGMFGVCDCV